MNSFQPMSWIPSDKHSDDYFYGQPRERAGTSTYDPIWSPNGQEQYGSPPGYNPYGGQPYFPPQSMHPTMFYTEHSQEPALLNADTSTYTCTYHDCTLRFETRQKLQEHMRDISSHGKVDPWHLDELLPYDLPDLRHAVPKFEWTYTDVALDNFYDPNTIVPHTKAPSNPSYLSPYRSNTNGLAQRLHAAQHTRSQSQSSSISRGVSPFRRDSPYQPSSSPHMRMGTAAQTCEQEVKANATYATKNNNEPKTISPKDMLLDYSDVDDEFRVSLFPGGGVEGLKRPQSPSSSISRGASPLRKDSPYQPGNSFSSHRISETQVFEIPSYLAESHRTNALGDYCAKYNFMKEKYALKLGLSIDRQQKIEVTIGSGKMVSTAGTATTTFQFGDEAQSYPLIFHLLPDCMHNLILGRPFLKATRTFSALSHFVRRVKTRILKGITQHHLLYLGDSTPKFQGLINGVPQDALADSGAKVMIMDEDYALSRGLSINTGTEYKTKLRFADNSTAYTSGMIHGVSWEFGKEGDNDSHLLDFHVLKRAPASVILSDTFLFGTEAFSKYNCYLVDDDDEDEEAYFFAIDIDKSSHGFQLSANIPAASARYIELIRRGEEEDRITSLPITLQNAARVSEHEQRAQWDRLQATLQRAPQNAVPSSVSSVTNSQVPSNQTSASSSSGLQQQSPVLQPKSRGRWRLKLKLKSATRND